MPADTLYHGAREVYDELEGSSPGYSGSLGWGLYLTHDPDFALVFGRYLHEVISPVPDEEVADLTDLILHDCGDSLVLGTPGASPFTFELADRRTGTVHRYSVLENCDLATSWNTGAQIPNWRVTRRRYRKKRPKWSTGPGSEPKG